MPTLAGMAERMAGGANAGPTQDSVGRQQANLLARGLAVDPGNDQLQDALRRFGPDISPDTLRALGLQPPEGDNGGILDSIKRGALTGVTRLLDVINRPSQAVLQAGRAGAEGGNILGGLWGGLSGRGDDVTFTEAVLGRGAQANGGLLGSAIDFVGTVATDPLSYVTAGTKPLAQVGLRTLVREGAPEAAEGIARLGLRGAIEHGLTSEEAVHAVLTRAAASTGLEGARLEGAIARQLRALETSGAGGIRFMGQTLPGTAGRRIFGGQALRSRIGADGALETFVREGGPIRQHLGDWLQPRAGVRRALGTNVATAVGGAESAGKGVAQRGVAETVPRILEALGRTAPAEVDDAYRGILAGAVNRDALPDALSGSLSALDDVSRVNVRTGAEMGVEVPTLRSLVERNAAEVAAGTAEHLNAPQLLLQQTMDLHKSAGFIDTMNRLGEVVDDAGRQLLHTDPTDFRARAVGATERITLPNGTKMYAPKPIAQEITKNLDILVSDEGMRSLNRFLNRGNTLWRSYATVFPAGFGFFSRNALGNVLNTFYAGMHDPRLFGKIAKMQAAVKRRGVEALGAEERRLIEGAIEHNVIESGRFLQESSDLLGETERRLSGKPTLGDRAVQAVGAGETERGQRIAEVMHSWAPTNPESVPLVAGRKINTALENNARLALYADGIQKGMSPAEAAIRVKKYLFDYADLTAVERRSIKPWVAFYTYMRNNVPLQVETMLKNPGKIAGQVHAIEATQGNFGANTPGGPLPSALIGQGGAPVGRNVLQMDLPLTSALDQIGPILHSAVAALPGGERFDPQESAADILGQLSGIRGGALKGMAEVVAGRSLFNGADIDTIGERNQTIVAALFPGVNKFQRTVERIGLLAKGDRAQLLNLALGIGVMPINDRTQMGEMFNRLDQIEAIINEMGEIPTLEELRDSGLVPERPSTASPTGSSRLGSLPRLGTGGL